MESKTSGSDSRPSSDRAPPFTSLHHPCKRLRLWVDPSTLNANPSIWPPRPPLPPITILRDQSPHPPPQAPPDANAARSASCKSAGSSTRTPKQLYACAIRLKSCGLNVAPSGNTSPAYSRYPRRSIPKVLVVDHHVDHRQTEAQGTLQLHDVVAERAVPRHAYHPLARRSRLRPDTHREARP